MLTTSETSIPSWTWLILSLSILNPCSFALFSLLQSPFPVLTVVNSSTASHLCYCVGFLADLLISYSEPRASTVYTSARLLFLNTLSEKGEGWFFSRRECSLSILLHGLWNEHTGEDSSVAWASWVTYFLGLVDCWRLRLSRTRTVCNIWAFYWGTAQEMWYLHTFCPVLCCVFSWHSSTQGSRRECPADFIVIMYRSLQRELEFPESYMIWIGDGVDPLQKLGFCWK